MAEAPDLRLNFGLVLLSLHKPLDIAEQIATADVMSGGKVIFGAALGYRDVEFLAFGTTQKERVKRFEENLEAIKRLWTEDTVDMVGSHFTLDGRRRVSPSPCRSRTRRSGSAPMPTRRSGAPRASATAGTSTRTTASTRSCGRSRSTGARSTSTASRSRAEFPARREVFVAQSRERGDPALRARSWPRSTAAYDQWGQGQAMPEGDNDLGVDFDELIRDRFLLGSPDEVAEQMLALHRATGINHLIMSVQWPGMPQSLVLDELHMLAEEVFPRVRQG